MLTCWIVVNSTAISSCIYVLLTCAHVIINKNGAIIQHIHLTFQKLCSRTESDTQNDQVCFMLTTIRLNMADLTIFTFKSSYLLT
ncbi:hypothetical protein D3C75_1315560 [compost metagenome]